MILSLLVFSLPQGPGSDFGWHKPTWEHTIAYDHDYRSLAFPDLTGDQVPELMITYWTGSEDVVEILDGSTGQVWATVGQAGPDYAQTYFFTDLDGDGISEFLLGNEVMDGLRGKLQVLHGGDGNLMWHWDGREANDQLGEEMFFQDADGDGKLDVVLGSRRNGKLFVLNGLTGTLLWSSIGRPHRFITQAPDWNGDGIIDLLVAGRGHITAIDGSSGGILWNTQFHILYGPMAWNSSFADLNGDGWDDVVLAHPFGDYLGNSKGGIMEARDGLTGNLLWATAGSIGQRLGSNLHAEDFNGDGVADLLSYFEDKATLLDGANGNQLWERRLNILYPGDFAIQLQDLSGDGKSDLVLAHAEDSGVHHNLQLWDGVTGATIWLLQTQISEEKFREIQFVDFDVDGLMDILVQDPQANVGGYGVGMIRAIRGTSGQDLWRLNGSVGQFVGDFLHIEEVDSVPGPDLVLCSWRGDAPRARFAVNGITGTEIWRQEYAFSAKPAYEWHHADVDGDGNNEIIEVQWNQGASRSTTMLAAFRTGDGSAVWNVDLDTDGWVPVFSGFPDFSGDGGDEIIVQTSVGYREIKLSSFTTSDMGWTSGLTLSADEVSASNGGQLHIDIDFPAGQSGWGYQLLLSEIGTGPTTINDLVIPLSQSYWLTSSYLGTYPGNYFSNPIGTLDGNGDQSIHFSAVPGAIPSSAVGEFMYAAVISYQSGTNWEFSSGSARIEIVP